MSGRRAKQRRRLVAMAMAGDQLANATLYGVGMSQGTFNRASRRQEMWATKKRVGRLANPQPGSWDPARAAAARAKLRRSFKRMLEL